MKTKNIEKKRQITKKKITMPKNTQRKYKKKTKKNEKKQEKNRKKNKTQETHRKK